MKSLEQHFLFLLSGLHCDVDKTVKEIVNNSVDAACNSVSLPDLNCCAIRAEHSVLVWSTSTVLDS